jgi:phage repressor protein C with HTH and peptisase S24 domain
MDEITPRAIEIGKRITEIRGKQTLPQFSASLGVARSTLIRYEKGDRLPDADFICAICQVYELDANWLLTGEKILTMADDEIAQIPVYDVDVSAGVGVFADQEEIMTYTGFQESWLRNVLGVNPQAVDIVFVRGDSMEPEIQNGDMILVDRQNNELRREGIYVFRLDGFLHVKRLQRLPDRLIQVTSDNVNYQPFTVDLKLEYLDFAILGRVVWRFTPV